MSTALVTGATSGIGNSFAHHLASRGHDLVIVARDTERLEKVASELRENYRVDVEILHADLAVRADVEAVAGRLEDPAKPVDILVNNAGFGLHTPILCEDSSRHERAFDVMVLAVLLLSSAAGRAMKARGHGTIINVGSTSGYITMGNYSAIKAWVNVFTECLSNELWGTGVHVTLLAPGWVHTEFHSRAGINQKNLPDWVWVDVDQLVTECLDDADKHKVLSVPTTGWRVAVVLADHLLPRRFIRWFSRRLNRRREK